MDYTKNTKQWSAKMFNNFESAKLEIMQKCPFARASSSNNLVSACTNNYKTCNIPLCPRRLV